MLVTKKIKIDMTQRGIIPSVDVMQSDANTRAIEAYLFSNGIPFPIEECSVSIAYQKPDGTSGWYDTMPDGSAAYEISNNVAAIKLAPQMLTVAGDVNSVIRIEDKTGTQRVATFPFVVFVVKDPAISAEKSEDYYSVSTWSEVNQAVDQLRESVGKLQEDFSGIINDNVIAKESSWSSKHIVDKLCPAFTETGEVVTCEPVEGYPVEVVTEFSSGDGVSGLTLWRGGKNFIGFADYSGIKSTNRTMACTGGVHTSTFTGAVFTSWIITNDVTENMTGKLLPPGTYVFSINQESTGRLYNKPYAVVELADGNTVTLSAGKAVKIDQWGTVAQFRCDSATGGFVAGTVIHFTLQIEAANTATEYEPYRGEEFTVDFERTVFGGSYDWSTGVLTEEWVEKVFDGTEDWFEFDYGIFGLGYDFSGIDISISPKWNNEKLTIEISDSRTLMIKGDFEDTSTFVDYLQENPVTVAMKATEAEVVEFEPVAIPALSGVNILFSSTGNTTVTGRADPLTVIAKQQTANESILERLSALEAAIVNNT